MRIVCLFLFYVVLWQSVFSQELSQLHLIGQAQRSPSDIVGIIDVNGRECAAIKVISDLDGFTYQVYNQLVRVQDNPGEDLVVVMPDERVLEIYHGGFEPLKVILSEIGIHLRPREVWVIKVTGDKKVTQIAIGIITNPPGAEVFLDGKSQGVSERLVVSIAEHYVQLSKPGYQTIVDTLQVNEKNTLFRYDLKKIQDVALFIESDPIGATVSLDGVKLGTTPLSTFYPPGRYKLQVEINWYITHVEDIILNSRQVRRKIELQENFAGLTVVSSPQSALDIFLNGLPQQCQTPHTFDRLAIGSYRVKARSGQYETEEVEIQLVAGEHKKISLTSSANFATLTIKTKSGAIVFLNDKKLQELENIRVEPSVVQLRAELNKAQPAEQRVVLRKGDSQTVELYPIVATGTIQIATVPFDAVVELRGDAEEYFTSNGTHEFADIPQGSYLVTVKQNGYETKQEKLVLHEGEKVTLSVILTAAAGLKNPIPNTEAKSVKQTSPRKTANAGVSGPVWREPRTGIEFILIKGGTFQMGDLYDDGDGNEKPVHEVTLGDFYLGKTEVTNKQFARFLNEYGSREVKKGPFVGKMMAFEQSWGIKQNNGHWQPSPGYENHPIQFITWYGAAEFCRFYGLRLPTEAEWEYAARSGGKKQKWPGADREELLSEYAWFNSAGGNGTHPVGRKLSNGLGLYDMAGNVWEWCQDFYDGDYYSKSEAMNPKGPGSGSRSVLRGGGWGDNAGSCRVSNRIWWYLFVEGWNDKGFRAARSKN